jgi:valyl-tRNA synthetase
MVKPGYEQPIDKQTLEATINFFEKLLQIVHPFTPFIAEELWHQLRDRKEGEDIIISAWPKVEDPNTGVLSGFEYCEQVITEIRTIRKQQSIANKVKLDLFVKKNNEFDDSFDSVIIKMGNLTQLAYSSDKIANSNSFIVGGNEYFIPFGESIDVEAERSKVQEELTYTKGFLQSVQKKLQNEKFVNSAPEQVVAIERKKEQDAVSKIALLEDKLASLK